MHQPKISTNRKCIHHFWTPATGQINTSNKLFSWDAGSAHPEAVVPLVTWQLEPVNLGAELPG